MRIYNRYVLSLTVAAALINSFLAFVGQDDLGIYFIINVICYLIITLLYMYFNPRARRVFNTIGVVFFAGFVVITIIEVLEIL